MQIGGKLKNIRYQMGLTQEELALRCELSKGFISQIENDLTSPSISTLIDILQALGTDLQEFFSESEPPQIVYRKKDVFRNEDEELQHTVSWLIPNAQKNQMEPMLLELRPEGRSKDYHPHEGEIFGYVLQGKVTLHMGKKKYVVGAGESFYLVRPALTYFLENVQSKRARLIWVSNPPLF